MNKSIIDSIIAMGIVVSIITYNSLKDSEDMMSMAVPIATLLLIVIGSLFKIISLKVIFSIMFIMLFSLFSLSPGMVDISSYVLVGILSLPIALLGTYAVKNVREDKIKNVSMIDWLHKKFLSMPLSVAFIINVVLFSVLMIGIVTFVGESFNIILTLLMILWSVLSSLSDFYFLNQA
ncbi:hypothetical protein [Vagococcus luciliae]|uniref:Beta-carotene 15,15'-monooxygenase n=1 Tax=Vagococcus luciliae TaxID=2920380 RepID=A0ABY5P1L8_9ENTE|nr:hypothetical protein [Vagococcus luciliae]UUV99825.1 hypothetical protein G314FT_19940 [Vagococcus luciliae]